MNTMQVDETEQCHQDVAMISRQDEDTVSVASSMHEMAIEQIRSNESINQDCLRKFMGVRRSRKHASVRLSYSKGSSRAARHSSNNYRSESDEIRHVIEHELSLIHGQQVRECTISKISSSLACVSCVIGGIPAVISRLSHDDVDEASLKIKPNKEGKRVAFLLDIVDDSEKVVQLPSKEEEADKSTIERHAQARTEKGRLSPQSLKIQDSIKRIRERINFHQQLCLDDYSQDGQLSFKETAMSSDNKKEEEEEEEETSDKPVARRTSSTSIGHLQMLSCLGFSTIIDDDIWSSDSFHPVPEAVSTLTFDDESFASCGPGR